MTTSTRRPHRGRGARHTSAVAFALALALGSAGCAGGWRAPSSAVASTAQSSASTTGRSSTTGPPSPGRAAADQAAQADQPAATAGTAATDRLGPIPAPRSVAPAVAEGLRPTRISVPAIGVDSSLADLGIAPNGTMEVPKDWGQAGWLDTSPAPGQQGPAIVAGHVDSTNGPAVFFRLRQLVVGDEIVITRRNGSRVWFTVDGVQTYLKAAFPTAETYGPVPGPALRLITCGGDFDRAEGRYRANVVVFAS